MLANFVGVHAVVDGDGGGHIQVFKHIECGADGQRVRHGIAPILHQAFFEKVVLLGGEGVLKFSGIGDFDFFVPPLVAHCFLPLEWRCLAHRYGEIGEGYREGGVGCALRHACRGRKTPLGTRPTIGDIHGAALGVFRKTIAIIIVKIITRISAGGKVYTGRKTHTGVGFGVLRVGPLKAEIFHLGIVDVAFLAIHGHQIAHIEIAMIFVALGIVALCRKSPSASGVELAGEGKVGVIA